MPEQELEIATADGSMRTFVAQPDGGGPFPVVLVYMDALGLRDELRDIARHVAAQGYYAVAPDLYYRFGDNVVFDAAKLGDPDSGEMQRMFGTMQQLGDDMVTSDTRAILERLESEPGAAGGPVGAVGFCMGGRLVVRAMTRFPERFAAGAALHPSFIVGEGPDSPHTEIGRMQGELYVGLGGADTFQPPAAFEPARAELEQHGVPHVVDVHEGADHGFMIPGAPVFHEQAAARCWERVFDLFRRQLQGAAVGV
jgi:carboxymethylenebutenolidase